MALIRSGGSLANLARATTAVGYSMAMQDDLRESYARIYRAQPQVRTVVAFLARNVADLGLQVFRRTSDTDRQRVTDHPFARLLASPMEGVVPYRFKETLVSDLCIYDTYYAVKLRTPRGLQLLRLNPEWVTPNDDGTWWASRTYTVQGTRGKIVMDREQLLIIHGYNPDDAKAGLPPMESLRQLLMEEYEAARYRRSMWRGGARMSGIISRPLDAPEWSDTAAERFRQEWQTRYARSGSDEGGTPILEDGMTFQQVSFSAEQAQYIEARKLTREEVAASYHVPPPMVGILDHATFSNITEQHKNLYQDTLGPWLTLIKEELEAQLLPEFAGSGDLYCEFNLQAKLRGTFEEQASQLQTAIGGPWMTRNEGRARVNLPAVDGGDDLITPLSVATGNGSAQPTTAGDDNADEDSSRAVAGGA